MARKNQKTFELIFSRPTPGGVKWADLVRLLEELGAKFVQGAGSRVGIYLFQGYKVLHRPHPSPDLDKATVAAMRKWLEEDEVRP